MEEKTITKKEKIALVLELLRLYEDIDQDINLEDKMDLLPKKEEKVVEAEVTGCYQVKDLQKILGTSRVTVYETIKKKEFPVRKIGNEYRIPKETFQEWLRKRESDDNEES